MAKKKKVIGRNTRAWKAHEDDAIRLAALRWFALTIEKSAIELYATDPRTYLKVVEILRHTLQQMSALREDTRDDEESCPEGYVLCNGLCMPSCADESDDSDNA